MKLISIGKFKQKTDYMQNIQDYKTWKAMSQYFEEIYLIVQSPDMQYHQQTLDKLHIYWVPGYKLLDHIFFLLISFILSIRLIRKHGIDVIDVGEPVVSGLMAVFLRRLMKKPLVTQLQGQLFNLPRNTYSPLKRELIRRITRYVCKNSDRIRVVSEEIRSNVIDAGIPEEKVFLSPSRCDTELFYIGRYEQERIRLRKRLDYCSEDIVLIFIGRLIPAKDVRSILMAVKELKARGRQVKLLIVGSGRLKRQLKEERERLSLSEEVMFLGRVSFDRIPQILSVGDIFVAPSLDEGMPRSVLEAMSMELPVIVTPVGGNAEIVKHGVNGMLVEVLSPEQIAVAVEKLMQNDELRSRIGRNARKTVVENYNFRPCIESFAKIHLGIRTEQNTGHSKEIRSIPSVEKPKKLIYIMNHYSADSVQHFYHIINLLKRLADRGIEIALIVEKCEGPLRLKEPRIKVYTQKERGRLKRAIELYRIVRRLIAKDYRRIYIRISTYATIITLLCAKIHGAKVYYWQSGDAFDYYKSLPIIPRIKWYLKSYSLYCLIKEYVDYFVTGPEHMLDYYATVGKVRREKLCLLYNDIDITRFIPPTQEEKLRVRKELGLKVNKTYILLIHRFSDYRRTSYYIPFINEFARDNTDIEFLIIGSGGDEEEILKEKIQESGLPNVVMLGSRPNAVIQNYYKACDIFINPSYSEGFPRVVIEAMASGLPIVATSAGGTMDLFGELQKDYVVPVEDRALFRDKLILMIADKKLQMRCGIENRRTVERYSTEKVARMYDDLIFGGDQSENISGGSSS